MADVSASPKRKQDPDAANRAKVRLRQGVWEASQFMDSGAIRAWVDAVLQEVESDEP